MKRIVAVTLAGMPGTLLAGAAFAGTPGIDHRQARQQVRIAHGVRCGELTRAEALRLRAGQRMVGRAERRAKADGFVNARERAFIQRLQNRESRTIWRLKHNGRSRV